MKKLCSFVIILVLLFVSGCSSLNENAASYIKDTVAYKEGDSALVVYFILADASGVMTTSSGKVYLTISESHSEWSGSDFVETNVELYSVSFNVVKTDFQKTKVGTAAFEHVVILCSFGRITYSSFTRKPSEMTGKVKIEFHPDGAGSVLTGSSTVIF